MNQVKVIWQQYLMRKSEVKSPIAGIFKKYLVSHGPAEMQDKKVPKKDEEEVINGSKEVEES